MEKITLQSVVAGKKDMVVANMDGEIVMMCMESGQYYNLGKMGGVIWEMIAQPIGVEQVVSNLLTKYEVTRQQCEDEVLCFLNKMNEQGLLASN